MGVNGHWYVELEKQAYWRGNPHTYVNRYVMSGAQPSAADATTVITALKGIEDHVFPHVAADMGVGFVEGRAYPSAKGGPFATVAYNTSLSAATATGFTGPSTAYTSLNFGTTLESCLVVETKLQGLSTTGKPIYLRKYLRGFYHNVAEEGVVTPIASADLAQIAGYTAPWMTGVGASNWVVIGNSGAQAAVAPAALKWTGNRQVPKGRKKKTSSSANPTFRIINLKALEDDGLALAEDVIPFA